MKKHRKPKTIITEQPCGPWNQKPNIPNSYFISLGGLSQAVVAVRGERIICRIPKSSDGELSVKQAAEVSEKLLLCIQAIKDKA